MVWKCGLGLVKPPVFSNYDGSFPKVNRHLISLCTVNSTILKDNAVCESRVKRIFY